jgi:mono/diheme cytochrome c family protein
VRRRERALAAAVLLAAPALAAAFPWSTDMYVAPSVQPFERTPRRMPPGVLPVAGGEPPMARGVAARVLANPFAPTPARLAHGKALFETSCTPCHGADGRGAGPVAYQLVLPPPDLTAGMPPRRTDGYVYATIRNGSVVMPAYGDATSVAERWELVLWVRALQARGGTR